jgi:hypothetical protein
MSTLWRQLRPGDVPQLRARHAAQGAPFAFPDFDDPRYVLAEVAECDGALLGAVAAHATVEMMFVGATPALLRAAVRERERLRARLLAAGCDEAHAFVPRALAPRMEPLLRRLVFRRSNEDFLPYYREL